MVGFIREAAGIKALCLIGETPGIEAISVSMYVDIDWANLVYSQE